MRSLPSRILCLVTDVGRAGGSERLLEIIKASVAGGVNMVQVRDHSASPGELSDLSTAVTDAVGSQAIVMVNGCTETALNSGAAGIHLRESATKGRDEVGPDLLIGQSTHTVNSAISAQERGADYVVVGTVFPSASHPGGPTGGTRLVSDAATAVTIPIIGIGGITSQNAAKVIGAGASGVAVIGAIIGSPDPESAARELAKATGIAEPA